MSVASSSSSTSYRRLVRTPPGLPWTQARTAQLEARLGAPIDGPGISVTVRRAQPWAFGAVGVFELVYARSDSVGAELASQAVASPLATGLERLGGVFSSPAGLAISLAVSVMMAGFGLALWWRAESQERLTAVEARLATVSRAVEEQARAARSGRIVASEGLSGSSLTDVLSELGWASRAREPTVEIRSLAWEAGRLSVETAGGATPFIGQDRTYGRDASSPDRWILEREVREDGQTRPDTATAPARPTSSAPLPQL